MHKNLANLLKTFAVFALMPLGISAAVQLVTTNSAQADPQSYCDVYARSEADRKSGTVNSSARGGIVGGIIGGTSGAVRGVTVGAVRGLLGNEGRRYKRYYKQAYDRCMRG